MAPPPPPPAAAPHHHGAHWATPPHKSKQRRHASVPAITPPFDMGNHDHDPLHHQHSPASTASPASIKARDVFSPRVRARMDPPYPRYSPRKRLSADFSDATYSGESTGDSPKSEKGGWRIHSAVAGPFLTGPLAKDFASRLDDLMSPRLGKKKEDIDFDNAGLLFPVVPAFVPPAIQPDVFQAAVASPQPMPQPQPQPEPDHSQHNLPHCHSQWLGEESNQQPLHPATGQGYDQPVYAAHTMLTTQQQEYPTPAESLVRHQTGLYSPTSAQADVHSEIDPFVLNPPLPVASESVDNPASVIQVEQARPGTDNNQEIDPPVEPPRSPEAVVAPNRNRAPSYADIVTGSATTCLPTARPSLPQPVVHTMTSTTEESRNTFDRISDGIVESMNSILSKTKNGKSHAEIEMSCVIQKIQTQLKIMGKVSADLRLDHLRSLHKLKQAEVENMRLEFSNAELNATIKKIEKEREEFEVKVSAALDAKDAEWKEVVAELTRKMEGLQQEHNTSFVRLAAEVEELKHDPKVEDLNAQIEEIRDTIDDLAGQAKTRDSQPSPSRSKAPSPSRSTRRSSKADSARQSNGSWKTAALCGAVAAVACMCGVHIGLNSAVPSSAPLQADFVATDFNGVISATNAEGNGQSEPLEPMATQSHQVQVPVDGANLVKATDDARSRSWLECHQHHSTLGSHFVELLLESKVASRIAKESSMVDIEHLPVEQSTSSVADNVDPEVEGTHSLPHTSERSEPVTLVAEASEPTETETEYAKEPLLNFVDDEQVLPVVAETSDFFSLEFNDLNPRVSEVGLIVEDPDPSIAGNSSDLFTEGGTFPPTAVVFADTPSPNFDQFLEQLNSKSVAAEVEVGASTAPIASTTLPSSDVLPTTPIFESQAEPVIVDSRLCPPWGYVMYSWQPMYFNFAPEIDLHSENPTDATVLGDLARALTSLSSGYIAPTEDASHIEPEASKIEEKPNSDGDMLPSVDAAQVHGPEDMVLPHENVEVLDNSDAAQAEEPEHEMLSHQHVEDLDVDNSDILSNVATSLPMAGDHIGATENVVGSVSSTTSVEMAPDTPTGSLGISDFLNLASSREPPACPKTSNVGSTETSAPHEDSINKCSKPSCDMSSPSSSQHQNFVVNVGTFCVAGESQNIGRSARAVIIEDHEIYVGKMTDLTSGGLLRNQSEIVDSRPSGVEVPDDGAQRANIFSPLPQSLVRIGVVGSWTNQCVGTVNDIPREHSVPALNGASRSIVLFENLVASNESSKSETAVASDSRTVLVSHDEPSFGGPVVLNPSCPSTQQSLSDLFAPRVTAMV